MEVSETAPGRIELQPDNDIFLISDIGTRRVQSNAQYLSVKGECGCRFVNYNFHRDGTLSNAITVDNDYGALFTIARVNGTNNIVYLGKAHGKYLCWNTNDGGVSTSYNGNYEVLVCDVLPTN